jgi:two-component system, chemotaxis family, chemotaxis protein CheY
MILNHVGSTKRALRALIADDDRFVRNIARLILEDAGFSEIVEAQSGAEATNRLQEQHFDLALLDINMPPIDGITLSRYIRATPTDGIADTPIVIMTGSIDRPTIERAKKAGIDQLCLKPLSPESLLRRVSAALTQRREAAAQTRVKLKLKPAF